MKKAEFVVYACMFFIYLYLKKIFTSLYCLHKENWVIKNRDGRELLAVYSLVILNFELL